jgi:hypothetical protein
MKFEAEIISEEVLPAIRSILANRLQVEYGLTQEEIAGKLGITQPAVSQYLNGTRANKNVIDKIKEDPQVDIILNDTVGKIARGEDYHTDVSSAVAAIRDKGLLRERFKDAKKL